MRLCFLQVACCEKRTGEIVMSIAKTRIKLHSLPILRRCLLEFAVFFQKGAIAGPSLGRLWFYPNGSSAFRRRLIGAAELVQNKGIARMVLGVVRFDPQRCFKMSLRLFSFPLPTRTPARLTWAFAEPGLRRSAVENS